jgi:hypothetical protein
MQSLTHYFALQNYVNNLLLNRFHQVKGFMDRQGLATTIDIELPTSLNNHLPVLIAKKQAQLLWHQKETIDIPNEVQQEVWLLLSSLQDNEEDWTMQIGHYIPWDPT